MGRGVDLCSRGALLPANDLLDLLLCGDCSLVVCRRKRCRGLFSLHPLGRDGWRHVCLDVGHGIGCFVVIWCKDVKETLKAEKYLEVVVKSSY